MFSQINFIIFLIKTHEEAVTALMASYAPLSYRQFPLRLYQVLIVSIIL